MDDLSRTILEAWERIGPAILNDFFELNRRLSRRRLKVLSRPMRPWCLAVRASDMRINPATTTIFPERACYPGRPDLFADHEVTLNARLLMRICRPTWIDPPGEDWKDVAKKLGCHQNNLVLAIRAGRFTVRRVKGLAGQKGKPVPVIYSPHVLDPGSGKVGEAADPLWANFANGLVEQFPEDFEQVVVRLPIHGSSYGHLVQRGWWWECPGCKKAARILYFPMPAPRLEIFNALDRQHPQWEPAPPPVQSFACDKCHGVRCYSRMDKNSWNELIHHLTGGLLYGYEVKKPDWLRPIRKRRFVSSINRKPSKRREEILERMLKGMKYKHIARDLGVSERYVRKQGGIILKQHGVKRKRDLCATDAPGKPLTHPVAAPAGASGR